MTDRPRISFGIIVLNGEPFTKYCLRALYPFAHEIIVIEGAAPGAADIATPDGHSTDGTLESLASFKVHEDPADKVKIVTREGYWSEKDEMSQAYAALATGDFLWQVDIDEFYRPEDMHRVVTLLRDNPSLSAMSFKQIQFWGGLQYYVDGWYLRIGGEQFHRLFRWSPGSRYVTHRPPTVATPEGKDTRALNWLDAYEMERRGIYLYHYSFLFPKQAQEKCRYYANAAWARRGKANLWCERAFMSLETPFRVHNVYEYPGWLERFHGTHPPQIAALMADIKAGRVSVELRKTDDIERLLESRWYRLGRSVLKATFPLAWLIRGWVILRKLASSHGDVSRAVRVLHEKAARLLALR